MKHIACICTAAIAFASVFTGCASTKKTGETKPNSVLAASKTVRHETIDWEGAGLGAEIADWLPAAMAGNTAALPASIKQKLEGKFYVIINTDRVRNDSKSTKDLKMVQEAASSQYMVNIGRSLNAAVDTRFNGMLSKNEDCQRTLMASAANARFSGFGCIADSWVLQRVVDQEGKHVTDTYTVVQIYTCDNGLWLEQASNYIRQLGTNSSSAEMKKAAGMADEIAASIKPGLVPLTSEELYADID